MIKSNHCYRRSTIDDINRLAPNLRESDVVELRDSVGMDALQALQYSLTRSDIAYTLFSSGIPVCMGGVAGDINHPKIGIAWFLASAGLSGSVTALQRWLPGIIEEMHTLYPTLGNFVDARNRTSHRWLSRLGFEIVGTCEHYGVAGLPFHWFVKDVNRKNTIRKRKEMMCVQQQQR